MNDGTYDEGALPQPTAPASIPVSLKGFGDELSARRFGDLIGAVVRSISRYVNLERLDGITVAFDYNQALAELERGYPASRGLKPTETDEIIGVAMAPSVLRDGIVKSHLVFYAPYVLGLEEENSDAFRSALYIVAHECGHVDDLKDRDEAFPNTILQSQITGVLETILEPISSALWNEYAACRLSALFGEQQTAVFEQSFVDVLDSAREKANAAIRSYRLHANVNQVLAEAGAPLCRPLKVAAYLVGHLDGLGLDFEDVPLARDRLVASSYAEFVDRLRIALQDLWVGRGSWKARNEFDVLRSIVADLFAHGGMIFRHQPDGTLRVDIPFTPDTVPEGNGL